MHERRMDEPHLSSLLDFLVHLPPVSGQRVRLYSALDPARPVDVINWKTILE